MTVGPRRPPQTRRLSNRKRLSSDAAIIIALMKNQPQDKDQLMTSSKVKERMFYRDISFLQEAKYVNCSGGMYSLWNFNPIEKQIEAALVKLTTGINQYTTIIQIANEIGKTWPEIEPLTLTVAKDLGYRSVGTGSQTMFLAP